MFNKFIKTIAFQVDQANNKKIESLKTEVNQLQSSFILLKRDFDICQDAIISLQKCVATLQKDYIERLSMEK